ncbi:hypothetical protein C8R45DRAFT_1082971 [Mycena sanguinolenta]|nr:hypothetical protein C8R45DRAFT_1082971 [Mycena sanguinolenta]
MSPTAHHLQPILALTLNNPQDPGAFCINALYSAIVQVVLCGPGLPYQVQFLDAAMKFMATPRSIADHLILKARLFSCRCMTSIPEIRELHSSPPSCITLEDLFQLALFQLCTALALCVDLFRTHPTAHDVSKRWPNAPGNINPFGMPMKQLCQALLNWAENPSSCYGVFTLIGATVALSLPFEIEVLKTPRVFQLATQQLQYALDNIPTHDIGHLWAPRFSARIYACAGNFFQSLARNRANIVEWILIHGGIQREMYAIARRMPPYLDPKAMDEERVWNSCAWFTAVCKQHGEAFVPCGSPHPSSSIAERGFLTAAWGLMVSYRSMKCAFGGCCYSEQGPRDSRACSKCGVARYCSSEHQRQSWKSSNLPHRSLCAAILALRSAIHMEDNETWTRLIHDTESGRASYAFLNLCGQHNVNPELGRAILVAAGFLR